MPKMLHSKGDGGVFLATPAYCGLSASYTHAIFNSAKALAREDIACELAIFAENCHVDDGRNTLVRDFLESSCDMLIFLDADLRWNLEDLIRLINYEQDVVAGIYPLKQKEDNYPVRFLPGEIWADNSGLIEVEAVPTGFLKIRRNVLEKLAKDAPGFSGKTDNPNKRKIPLIFERTLEGSTRWGGDYTFCRKWRETGGKIYIDPEMNFAHEGMGEWTGSLGNHLRNKNGLTDEYIRGILAKISNGEEDSEDLLNLCSSWNNDWSVTPDFLAAMIMLARENEGTILECGSGITTLVLSALGCKTIALEHDDLWKSKMNLRIDRMGYNSAEVHHAPIKDYGTFEWYCTNEIGPFSMVVVDGPPREIGRSGFLHVMKDNLADDCVIMADDAGNMTEWEDILSMKFAIMGNDRKFAVGKTGKV